MKSSVLTLGWMELLSKRVLKHKFRLEARVEKEALRYDAFHNRYSISPKSVPANLFYSMELGARSLIEVWPFFRNRLLDIDCGNKPYALFINSLVKKYIGTDQPNQAYNGDSDIFAVGSVLPFKSESFDTILSVDMLDGVSSPLDLLKEVNRILKSDGYLVLMVSNHFNIYRDRTIYAHYTSDGLRFLAEQTGFNVAIMRSKGRFIPFMFNLFIQLCYRFKHKLSNTEGLKSNGRYRNSMFDSTMLLLQRFLLKITPEKSIKSDVKWDDPIKSHIISGNFHLGYLMVAKKVFQLEENN
jgi:SAM-dependent methyltransferase